MVIVFNHTNTLPALIANGPECRGGGEDTIACEKLRKFQILQDFNCTVTSTWTNNDDNREFHTWLAWRSRVCKKQLDCAMGPKDIRSTTWYLNRVRFRTWDHFLVIIKIEGRELKTKRRDKGWARWAFVSEAEKAKFQEIVLCPRSDHHESSSGRAGEEDGLAVLHDRLVEAVAEEEATTTSSRNKNKCCVPEEIRRDPVRRRHLRKIAHRVRGGKSGATQRQGDEQTCGHEALGQRPR